MRIGRFVSVLIVFNHLDCFVKSDDTVVQHGKQINVAVVNRQTTDQKEAKAEGMRWNASIKGDQENTQYQINNITVNQMMSVNKTGLTDSMHMSVVKNINTQNNTDGKHRAGIEKFSDHENPRTISNRKENTSKTSNRRTPKFPTRSSSTTKVWPSSTRTLPKAGANSQYNIQVTTKENPVKIPKLSTAVFSENTKMEIKRTGAFDKFQSKTNSTKLETKLVTAATNQPLMFSNSNRMINSKLSLSTNKSSKSEPALNPLNSNGEYQKNDGKDRVTTIKPKQINTTIAPLTRKRDMPEVNEIKTGQNSTTNKVTTQTNEKETKGLDQTTTITTSRPKSSVRNLNLESTIASVADTSGVVKMSSTPSPTKSTSNKKLDSSNLADDLDGAADEDLSNRCTGLRNDASQYTKSAVVSAAVGGMFIGAVLVFFLFYARGKCRRYVHGDYRRVPMEYDFELNPRFKTR